LNRTLSHEDLEEIGKEINVVSNERLNGYELGFGSGLSPNGSGERLLGQILANGLVERAHTWRPDRPMVAGMLGLSWLGWATRKVGKAGQVGPTRWISAQEPFSNKNFFLFQIYLINYKSI
jgi:hypothetical protein